MSRYSILGFLKPAFMAFIVINVICFGFARFLDGWNIDHYVLAGGNMLLFVLSVIIAVLNVRAAANTNANVFMRSVMAGIFIKMIVVAVAAVIYFVSSGENKSVYAVALCMIWYVVYTVIEVKSALRLNKKQLHAGN